MSMKGVALLLCVVAAVFASAIDTDEEEFKAFMSKHGRRYQDQHEYDVRLAAFKATLRRIEYQNSRQPHAHYAVDQYADMTLREFKEKYLLMPFPGAVACQWPFNGTLSLNGAPPASFDWRTKGAVTPVKDQQQCGSCWSFSVSGNIEGQWFLKQGKLVSLSEQEIVDCSKSCLAPPNQGLCNAGCGGGLPWLAYNDIISKGGLNGLTTEAAYPYVGVDQTCKTNVTAAAKISSWVAVGTDVSIIQAYLAAHGPLSITLNANMLFSYSSGIITGTPSDCPGSQSDHAVLLVGYGKDAASGVDYWIVKNSWNTSWGDQGYFKIASDAVQGESLCGINLCVTSAVA
eukprot:gnl/Spiro4/5245_TR2649_c0_g1_i1.p1 gnl/Spiro4/5245_TR2649_c0_g1~~gnl/Spiro4/5245_TR2649_c0_g1_i1.p1  ORF type:complete len:354 (-),score=68.56 gnl/Spiro4/5245_TR2649_c0_g1_i1:96-1127(-)